MKGNLPDPVAVARMQRCLSLARKGQGRVAPNPLVGCVIEREGRVVAEGYHRRYGGAHAEIEALQEAGKRARGATLYVNLEPCNHTGKTPPCTEAILRAGIKTVVIGMRDPNREVKGGGMRRLRSAGLEVIAPICERDCAAINREYLVNVTRHRPYVVLKIAQTLDGFIAQPDGRSKWITGEKSRHEVHRLRRNFDAILVGAETVRRDDPGLLPANLRRPAPLRLVLTASGALSPKSAIFTDPHASRTRIVTTSAGAARLHHSKGFSREVLDSLLSIETGRDGDVRIQDLLAALHARGIHSLLVEGGSRIFSRFLDADCADALMLFIAPKILGTGVRAMEGIVSFPLNAPERFAPAGMRRFGEDYCLHYIRRD